MLRNLPISLFSTVHGVRRAAVPILQPVPSPITTSMPLRPRQSGLLGDPRDKKTRPTIWNNWPIKER
ncbi:hypothetical protein I7I50_06390 [Histoplasma capsulatum G186AR]|uniref:Uncharacterized protein n=1 Tax=Ajellomyces capsulatus TaxID=5037 RepID=A0A8H7YWU7_AJECA|nr:hypothetical protein I7I52_10535 [Histoplasma capsulatum]QSS67346.1 hypothetical protein I7I50_06390 [Histoplasma capsulatum G186AR]